MITAELVDGCHLKCRLCWNRERRGTFKNMSLETIQLVLDKYGQHRIWWHNWGEPLLHKDFVRVADMIAGTRAIISTSFSLPVSDEKFDALCKFKVIVVSLSGLTAEVYNKYNIGGDFDLVMKNLTRLKKRNHAKVIINWLGHSDNNHQLVPCAFWCGQSGFAINPKVLNCQVEDSIAGFEDRYLKTVRSKHDSCVLEYDITMDVEGNYLVCCASRNVKIGLNIRDNVTHEEIREKLKATSLCKKCHEHEYWRMYH